MDTQCAKYSQMMFLPLNIHPLKNMSPNAVIFEIHPRHLAWGGDDVALLPRAWEAVHHPVALRQ